MDISKNVINNENQQLRENQFIKSLTPKLNQYKSKLNELGSKLKENQNIQSLSQKFNEFKSKVKENENIQSLSQKLNKLGSKLKENENIQSLSQKINEVGSKLKENQPKKSLGEITVGFIKLIAQLYTLIIKVIIKVYWKLFTKTFKFENVSSQISTTQEKLDALQKGIENFSIINLSDENALAMLQQLKTNLETQLKELNIQNSPFHKILVIYFGALLEVLNTLLVSLESSLEQSDLKNTILNSISNLSDILKELEASGKLDAIVEVLLEPITKVNIQLFRSIGASIQAFLIEIPGVSNIIGLLKLIGTWSKFLTTILQSYIDTINGVKNILQSNPTNQIIPPKNPINEINPINKSIIGGSNNEKINKKINSKIRSKVKKPQKYTLKHYVKHSNQSKILLKRLTKSIKNFHKSSKL